MNKKNFLLHCWISLIIFILLILGFSFLDGKYVDTLWIITFISSAYILSILIIRFLYLRTHKKEE
jgi:energy-converting hydrogenase Eha subunit E